LIHEFFNSSKLLQKVSISLIFILISSANAGPPLVTDDTGVLAPGGWEVIAWSAGQSRPATDSTEFPTVEVSYGFHQDMQLTAAMSRQVIEDRGERSKSGWGNAAVGYKWQFYNQNGNSVAVAPAYVFPLTSSSRLRGIAEDVRVLVLPLVGSIQRGKWTFAGQMSYDWTSASVNAVGYGVWTGYNVTNAVQLLAEVYGAEFSGDENDDEGITNWRLGATWGFSGGFTLLAGYGGDIRSDLAADDKLDYDYFLGLQWQTQ
jgi:hypothetical protein